LKNKNVKNVFSVKPLQEHIFHPYETEVRKYVDDADKAIATDGIDFNTALRTSSEKINKDVETFIKNE
jgi:multiple sugar transport system substrate-binding protein